MLARIIFGVGRVFRIKLQTLFSRFRRDAAVQVGKVQVEAQRALAARFVFDKTSDLAGAVQQFQSGDAVDLGEGVEIGFELRHF